MNIQPVKSEGAPPPVRPKAPPAKAPEAPAESESSGVTRETKLREMLAQEPAVRSEEVARAKVLATDPDYPSNDILAKIASMIVDGTSR
jgi:hypothetical protein